MTDELKQAFTLRISQANKSQMVVILYEMILAYVQDAEAAINAIHEKNEAKQPILDDKIALKEAIRKARGCNCELMESLDLEYEVAGRLLSLYTYVNRELIMSEIRRSEENLEHVERVIKPLLKAYREVAKSDTDSPIMTNTQSVVVGLTYGPLSVSETVTGQEANRGFLV